MNYYITTLCIENSKYNFVRNKWFQRTTEKCPDAEIIIFDYPNIEKDIWKVRLNDNLELSNKINKPIVMCDLDVIIEKNIIPLINLPYDIIISQEIGGNKAYPADCSSILGFGVCMGFSIFKPDAFFILNRIKKCMDENIYNTQDDQVLLMKNIVNNSYYVDQKDIKLNNKSYICNIIYVLGIQICVLNPDIIIRDPILNIDQYANHINLDNVGGPIAFLRYFDEDLDNLPLTCRCGKTYLGDNSICKHINLRNLHSS